MIDQTNSTDREPRGVKGSIANRRALAREFTIKQLELQAQR
jgi:hypothetical protein